MSQFVLTQAAEDDIREILHYIERDNPLARNPMAKQMLRATRSAAR